MSRSFRNTFRNNSRSFSNVGNTEKEERDRVRGNISDVETSEDQFGGKADGRGGSLERNAEESSSYKRFKESYQQESYSRSRTPMKYDNSNSSTTRQSSQMRNPSQKPSLSLPQIIQNQSLQQQASLHLKRYRSLIDHQQQPRQSSSTPSPPRTTSTTKLDMMILFQQLKEQLHVQQIQKSIQQNVHETIKKWKQQTQQLQKRNLQQHYKPIYDTDLMFESQQGVLSKWSDQEDIQKRKQAIQQLQKQRIRQRSPLSNRFRMMHECQTNQRRMYVQMACVFLNIEVFYYLQDLEILSVEEMIFSENQQIVVLRAYAVEYEPKVGMMKLEPKRKVLVSVYKFSALTELIRLENTYGGFDGIVVYPESFHIQKYLMNSKELSLVNQKYSKDIKTQIQSNKREEKPVPTPEQKINY